MGGRRGGRPQARAPRRWPLHVQVCAESRPSRALHSQPLPATASVRPPTPLRCRPPCLPCRSFTVKWLDTADAGRTVELRVGDMCLWDPRPLRDHPQYRRFAEMLEGRQPQQARQAQQGKQPQGKQQATGGEDGPIELSGSEEEEQGGGGGTGLGTAADVAPAKPFPLRPPLGASGTRCDLCKLPVLLADDPVDAEACPEAVQRDFSGVFNQSFAVHRRWGCGAVGGVARVGLHPRRRQHRGRPHSWPAAAASGALLVHRCPSPPPRAPRRRCAAFSDSQTLRYVGQYIQSHDVPGGDGRWARVLAADGTREQPVSGCTCAGAGWHRVARSSRRVPPTPLPPRTGAFRSGFGTEVREAQSHRCSECGETGASASCTEARCQHRFHLHCAAKCKVDAGGPRDAGLGGGGAGRRGCVPRCRQACLAAARHVRQPALAAGHGGASPRPTPLSTPTPLSPDHCTLRCPGHSVLGGLAAVKANTFYPSRTARHEP